MFTIDGSVALVTGANRGMGWHYTQELLARGATKVYAGVRDPDGVDVPGATVLKLDITDPASVAAAATQAPDVNLLINNAGMSRSTDLITSDLGDIRQEMETNFFGPLTVTRAFAPVLAANGGGAILNMLSALSWFSLQGSEGYAAGKAAAWSLTNGVRLSLQEQGTQVTGLLVGAVRTDFITGYEGPAEEPDAVVRLALDGLVAGDYEILADDWSRMIKASLAEDPRKLYRSLAEMFAGA